MTPFETSVGQVSLQTFATDFKPGFEPDGTGCYYGLSPLSVASLNGPLSTTLHSSVGEIRAFFSAFAASLAVRQHVDKALVIGLEPSHVPENDDTYTVSDYNYALKNRAFVKQFASDLAALQKSASDNNNNLAIYVRYASEMNTAGADYPTNQQKFKESFHQVRTIFSETAPNIRFAYSPAITPDYYSAHHDEPTLEAYFPDNDLDLVDVMGGTWFLGAKSNAEAWDRAWDHLSAYTKFAATKGKPFGLCEFGVAKPDPPADPPVVQQVDDSLAKMLAEIRFINPKGKYEYANLLIQAHQAATFRFLQR